MAALSPIPVTPSDDDLPQELQGLYVGGAGDVVVGEPPIVFHAVQAGTLLPIRVRRLRTATTATQLVGLVP